MNNDNDINNDDYLRNTFQFVIVLECSRQHTLWHRLYQAGTHELGGPGTRSKSMSRN